MGPWPLAPHHDYLQYIHLMQRGQNRGVTMDTPKIMNTHIHSNGYLIEMEKNSSPSVVACMMGLEEILDNSTPTSQRTGALYLSQSEENYGFIISLEVGKSFQYYKAMESTKQAEKKKIIYWMHGRSTISKLDVVMRDQIMLKKFF